MLDVSLHRQNMLMILKDVYSQVELRTRLGFKGGTAAYFLDNLPRFSVDLDFDLLVPQDAEIVFGEMAKILAKYGELKQKTNKKETLFFILSYSLGVQSLKVEVSKRIFGSTYETRGHLGIPMLVMKREDMFAHKLVAITGRKQIANRDIFDVHFFLQENWPINSQIVEKRTGLPFLKYLRKCIEAIEALSPGSLIGGLGELVSEKQKQFIKTGLRDDVLVLLRIRQEAITKK